MTSISARLGHSFGFADYATNFGWHLVPVRCANGQKRPATPNGVKDASNSPQQIQAWSQQSFSGFGVVCGELSGITVIDCDVKEFNGVRNFQAWCEANGVDLSRVPFAMTPSGGRHYYFQYCSALTKSRPLPDIGDVRNNNTMVVLPGTIAENGSRYNWGPHPSQLPPRPMEDALIQFCLSKDKTTSRTPMDGTSKELPLIGLLITNEEIDKAYKGNRAECAKRLFHRLLETAHEPAHLKTAAALFSTGIDSKGINDDCDARIMQEMHTAIRIHAPGTISIYSLPCSIAPYSDATLAELVTKANDGKIIYASDVRTFYAWRDNHFEPEAGSNYVIKETIDSLLPGLKAMFTGRMLAPPEDEKDYYKHQNKELKALIHKLNTSACRTAAATIVTSTREICCRADELDSDQFVLHTKNKTLRFSTDGKLAIENPHPSNRNTWGLPISYDPAATCPRFEKALLQMLKGNAEVVEFLGRYFGYSLLGDVSLEKCVIALGSSAHNGKSMLIRIMRELLGDAFFEVKSARLTTATDKAGGHDGDITGMIGKRFVAMDEVDDNCVLNDAWTKKFVSNSAVNMRRLHQESRLIPITWKLFIATNNMPQIYTQGNGLWRRLCIVRFEQRFEWPGQYDPETDSTILPIDGTLEPHILQHELPGILNWLVAHLQRLLQDKSAYGDAFRGCYSQVQKWTNEIKGDADILAPFIEARCIIDPAASVTLKDLYSDFEHYCVTEGGKSYTNRHFSKMMQERGYSVGKGTDNKTFIFGIRIAQASDYSAPQLPAQSAQVIQISEADQKIFAVADQAVAND